MIDLVARLHRFGDVAVGVEIQILGAQGRDRRGGALDRRTNDGSKSRQVHGAARRVDGGDGPGLFEAVVGQVLVRRTVKLVAFLPENASANRAQTAAVLG